MNLFIHRTLRRRLSVPRLGLGVLLLLFYSCKEPDPPTVVVVKNDETYAPEKVKAVMDEWQRKNFSFFFEGASPTGLALEGNERGDVVTTGGTGFGIMALIVGVDRGFITREQGVNQIKKIVNFLGKAERFKGAWSHWYNPDGTAHPFGDQVKTGDLIESSFLMAGLLTAKEYFSGSSSSEKEIRDSVASFSSTINWRFYSNNENVLKWLWYSQENRFVLNITGWNEGLISYILGLGAPEPHNISAEVYKNGWMKNGTIVNNNRKYYEYKLPLGEPYGGPMFFAHYSFLGIDPNNLNDAYANYFTQNKNHTLINYNHCVNNPNGNFGYSNLCWGLTASDIENDYTASSPTNDRGFIAPTAALSSFPYTPAESMYALKFFYYKLGDKIWGNYGFVDAFSLKNPWFATSTLAIDQGPIIVMIENYRTGLLWNLFTSAPEVKAGMRNLGFTAPYL